MVSLGFRYINLAKKKLIGLERVKTYISRQNNEGIWHGAGVKTAHVETFSGKKTKRQWKPNVAEREYYSDLLDEKLQYSFSMKAVRAIDYAGGFDNYILRTPDDVLVSRAAISLKRRMETVQRMLAYGDKSLEEIKAEITPKPYNKHVYIPREHTNRYYFEWKGVRRHTVYC